MIALRPYDDLSALAIFQALDPCDQYEVELVRGAVTPPLALFAEWRALQAGFVASYLALTRHGSPFAAFGLMPTGQAGVAAAALLARDHRYFRRPIAEAAMQIRAALPRFCADAGIRRVEARSWSDHPTAKALLRSLGFCEECTMSGFGPTGQVSFTQYARLFPRLHPDFAPEE